MKIFSALHMIPNQLGISDFTSKSTEDFLKFETLKFSHLQHIGIKSFETVCQGLDMILSVCQGFEQ